MTDNNISAREAKVKINDVDYSLSDFSKEAKEQLMNVRFAESEVRRLQAQLAVAQTARNAYQQALLAQMKNDGMMS